MQLNRMTAYFREQEQETHALLSRLEATGAATKIDGLDWCEKFSHGYDCTCDGCRNCETPDLPFPQTMHYESDDEPPRLYPPDKYQNPGLAVKLLLGALALCYVAGFVWMIRGE